MGGVAYMHGPARPVCPNCGWFWDEHGVIQPCLTCGRENDVAGWFCSGCEPPLAYRKTDPAPAPVDTPEHIQADLASWLDKT